MTRPTDFRGTVERLVADPKLPDLTMRQLAMLLILRDEPKVDCTVRGIARRLNISKPAVTRGASTLEHLMFAQRQPDPADRRSIFLRLTPRGHAFMRTLPAASAISEAA